jgi:hypothetical protein
MNRSRKDVTLMAVMGALLLFAVFNFVFKPQRSELSAAHGDLQQMEKNVSDADLQLRAPVTTSVPDPAEAAPSAIPADPAESTLLRQLHSIAETTGVALTSISPTPLAVNPSGPGGSLLISITASGPHDSVQAYLQQLRDMDRLVVIEQVGLTSQAATDLIGPTDQLQLSVRVFTLQPPAIAPSGPPTSTP